MSRPEPAAADPYRTAGLRARVLETWAGSPARFREDANAEDELARDSYRDRLVTELAQNAVDAAAPGPTRLLLRLESGADGERLVVANTGRLLDAAGVAGLASLRASAKRDAPDAVGRFGVGFAAVLGLGSRVSIGSRGRASVRFDRDLATEAVRAAAPRAPGLVAELDRRGGQLAMLRLPFAAPPLDVPHGYDTAVVVELDGAPALARVLDLLAGIDPLLALAMPGLAELRVEADQSGTHQADPAARTRTLDRVLTCRWHHEQAELDGEPWLLAEQVVQLPGQLWEERPAEERGRAAAAGYRVRLRALARADGAALPAGSPCVLRAPQPTDDPLTLPAVLSLPLPLDSTRRRSLPGPLRDRLLELGGGLLADLAPRLADPLALVPVGLAAGEADALVRRAALLAMRSAPLLPGGRRPGDAVVLDLGPGLAAGGAEAAAALADVLPGLLPAAWWGPARAAALDALGVERLDTAALVDRLAGLSRPPAFWAGVYAALEGASDRDALGALPVPLADGRTVTGARGAVLVGAALAGLAERVARVAAAAGALPRLVAPAAAHPLLLGLGARAGDADELLDFLRPAVESSQDLDETTVHELTGLVLDLVAAGAGDQERHPFLAELTLPGADGERWPAEACVHPAGALAPLLDPAALGGLDAVLGVLADPPAGEHPLTTWAALGVLTDFTLARAEGVALGQEATGGALDDEAGYHRYLLAHRPALPVLDELVGVRDLDLVADWPAALRRLAAEPALRAALLEPARLDGQAHRSYTSWWLAGHPVLGGRLPAELRLASAEPVLAGLYDPAPGWLDPHVGRALGCAVSLADLLADPERAADLLDRLGDAERTVERRQIRLLYGAAAAALAGLADPPDPPLAVRALDAADALVVVAPRDALVVDSPDLLGVLDRPRVPVRAGAAAALARLLGVPLASAELAGRTGGGAGSEEPVPLAGPWPPTWRRVSGLTVAGVPVRWRVEDGRLLARDEASLARAMAWAGGCWERRAGIAEAVGATGSPEQLARLAAEGDLDDDPPRPRGPDRPRPRARPDS